MKKKSATVFLSQAPIKSLVVFREYPDGCDDSRIWVREKVNRHNGLIPLTNWETGEVREYKADYPVYIWGRA